MSIRSHRWGALAAAGVLVSGGLLSGCGVSDEQLRPGVAAQIGDTELALDDIDDAIADVCDFFTDQQQAAFPRSLVRQQFVSVLIQRAAASAALDEADLALGSDFQQAVSGLDAANAQVPEAQRAPFVRLAEATTFIDAAATSLGTAAFSSEGDVPADPAIVTDRGRSIINEWIATNDVEVNPVFRLTVADDGQVVADQGGTSVATSDYASTGFLDPLTATEEQVVAAADQLPSSQLCGASSEG